MLHFKPSTGQSVGVEIEFQLLDPVSFDLVDGILPLLELCSEHPHIVPEYDQATVEINTRICKNIKDVKEDIFSLTSIISEKCRELGMVISGGGTHPFCSRFAKVTPLPRFLSMERVEGYLGYTSTTYALHVHVGMSNGEETIAVMQRLRSYLPVLIALSASSPFRWGHDTGFACFRQRVLASMRSYGIPPVLENWKVFSDFYKSALRAKAFNSLEDIHWDIRPRPDMGTLEVRVMDAQPTIGESVILSSFVYVLVTHIRKMLAAGRKEGILRSLHYWAEKENYFRATRSGIDTICIVDNLGNTRPMKDLIEDIIDSLSVTAYEMGESEHLKMLKDVLAYGPGYVRQRKIFNESGSLRKVAAFMVRELEEDLDHDKVTSVRVP